MKKMIALVLSVIVCTCLFVGFYTTPANRMARHLIPKAVTVSDIIGCCGGELPIEPEIPEATVLPEPKETAVMETNTGGGFKKVLGRMFSGESIFMNEYTAQGGSGMIAFASSFPGSIIPYQVTPGNGIIVQKRGFLAMEKGLELSVYFQKKLGKAELLQKL